MLKERVNLRQSLNLDEYDRIWIRTYSKNRIRIRTYSKNRIRTDQNFWIGI